MGTSCLLHVAQIVLTWLSSECVASFTNGVRCWASGGLDRKSTRLSSSHLGISQSVALCSPRFLYTTLLRSRTFIVAPPMLQYAKRIENQTLGLCPTMRDGHLLSAPRCSNRAHVAVERMCCLIHQWSSIVGIGRS